MRWVYCIYIALVIERVHTNGVYYWSEKHLLTLGYSSQQGNLKVFGRIEMVRKQQADFEMK